MEKYVVGIGILAVAAVFAWLLLRPRPLTEQEKDFVKFVHAQARRAKLSTKEEISKMVADHLEGLEVLYAINGVLILHDVPRIMKEIVNTYKPA